MRKALPVHREGLPLLTAVAGRVGVSAEAVDQNPAPPDWGAVVDGEVPVGAVVVGEFWTLVFEPLEPQAAAPTPSMATRAIGAILRVTFSPVVVLDRLMKVILLDLL